MMKTMRNQMRVMLDEIQRKRAEQDELFAQLYKQINYFEQCYLAGIAGKIFLNKRWGNICPYADETESAKAWMEGFDGGEPEGYVLKEKLVKVSNMAIGPELVLVKKKDGEK